MVVDWNIIYVDGAISRYGFAILIDEEMFLLRRQVQIVVVDSRHLENGALGI